MSQDKKKNTFFPVVCFIETIMKKFWYRKLKSFACHDKSYLFHVAFVLTPMTATRDKWQGILLSKLFLFSTMSWLEQHDSDDLR